MNTELLVNPDDALMTDVAPSAAFVRAVSDFLDTDPATCWRSWATTSVMAAKSGGR